ncbi:hypothetical protein H6F98_27060 [Microcoleus sp. FACHB-SPT15]|nr:hypothetical protein [Microcoleus sp. FACHB-SPT15]MBD1809087.1 hypothetical protein [Microcoleus sp. FACHB-SPT15]
MQIAAISVSPGIFAKFEMHPDAIALLESIAVVESSGEFIFRLSHCLN